MAELSESDELPLLEEEDEDPDEDDEDELPEDPEVLPLNLGFGGILINNSRNLSFKLSFNFQNSSFCVRFHFCSILPSPVPRPEVWFGMFRNISYEQCRVNSLVVLVYSKTRLDYKLNGEGRHNSG